jgi:hypothetical protein
MIANSGVSALIDKPQLKANWGNGTRFTTFVPYRPAAEIPACVSSAWKSWPNVGAPVKNSIQTSPDKVFASSYRQ